MFYYYYGRRGISIVCCHSQVCYMSYVKLNKVFLPCCSQTGPSFPAGVQRGLLFPAGNQDGLLSLLVFHGCCYFTNFLLEVFTIASKQNKRFQRKRHLKTRWRLWWPSWISDRHSLSYFQSRGHPVASVSFNSNGPMVWEKSKIRFQDDGYGGHFRFPIGMIHLVVCYKMSKTDFQDCGCQPTWISDRHDLGSFRSRSFPVPTEQVLAQTDQRLGRDVEN